VIEIKRYWEQN